VRRQTYGYLPSLKQLTHGDRTTSDGKLFHNVTVAGKKPMCVQWMYPMNSPVETSCLLPWTLQSLASWVVTTACCMISTNYTFTHFRSFSFDSMFTTVYSKQQTINKQTIWIARPRSKLRHTVAAISPSTMARARAVKTHHNQSINQSIILFAHKIQMFFTWQYKSWTN